MQTYRVQPLTVMTFTALGSLTHAWVGLIAFGAIMLIGAWHPPLSLLDRWVGFVTRSSHQTVLSPKRFAAGMGGAMLILSGLAGLLGRTGAAWTFAAMTFAAAGLLAFFKFCLGCWIYNALLYRQGERQEA